MHHHAMPLAAIDAAIQCITDEGALRLIDRFRGKLQNLLAAGDNRIALMIKNQVANDAAGELACANAAILAIAICLELKERIDAGNVDVALVVHCNRGGTKTALRASAGPLILALKLPSASSTTTWSEPS